MAMRRPVEGRNLGHWVSGSDIWATPWAAVPTRSSGQRRSTILQCLYEPREFMGGTCHGSLTQSGPVL